jgi:hypothetical protein
MSRISGQVVPQLVHSFYPRWITQWFSPYLSPWCWLAFVYLFSCFGGDPEIIRTSMGYFFPFDVKILKVVGLLL